MEITSDIFHLQHVTLKNIPLVSQAINLNMRNKLGNEAERGPRWGKTHVVITAFISGSRFTMVLSVLPAKGYATNNGNGSTDSDPKKSEAFT